jgi:multimeric flavodoxin WrbA
MPDEPAATAPDLEPRKGSPSPRLDESEFRKRFLSQFKDRAYETLEHELGKVAAAAWDAYANSRKSPITRKAGPGFADPDYDLATDWLAARDEIRAAQARFEDESAPLRVLLINGSSRSEHSCPGELSKSFRMVEIAKEVFAADGVIVTVLDLSRIASEYGRQIHPCKACFSTSAALCHWPCSCYPNHALGQVQDWMNDIYPMWVAAHGIMIVTPVNWYGPSSVLKLMIDRLVCADGGNPDPTTTQGKTVKLAKALELEDWHYPRHLAGRVFSLVVHGDAAGVGATQNGLSNWLTDIGLIEAGHLSQVGAYIGYMQPYASSHDALDNDNAAQEETRNAARSLVEAVKQMRSGGLKPPDRNLREPRPK